LLNYTDAENHCKAWSGALLSLNSQHEYDSIIDRLGLANNKDEFWYDAEHSYFEPTKLA